MNIINIASTDLTLNTSILSNSLSKDIVYYILSLIVYNVLNLVLLSIVQATLSSKTSSTVEAGNTVVIIEHNLDVIKIADYVIDLGPEGGVNGGQIIATGTPEEVAKISGSYTGQYLKEVLKRAK